MNSSLGEEVYASSDMMGHVALLREFYAPFVEPPPGMAGVEDCEGLSTHIKTQRAISAKHFARRFLGNRQRLDGSELDNAYWLAAPENPAD